MLSLQIGAAKLCLAKFTVLILLAAFQMVMFIGAYYICAAIVTRMQDYNFILEPLYVSYELSVLSDNGGILASC